MRWSDTRREASFFGVNYTLPFAHAYRAMGYLGIDRKAAIDKDVYHFARLGFNAYRIHIWDVEITDGQGNLIENEHLELLDYLIARLKERDIRIVITAQTNFGNGYPERNQPTGGFSLNYDKCNVHADPEAIAAQERYIASLVKHVNPYTGHAYQDDPFIIGFEINNEPCHAGTQVATKAYIDRMLAALKQAGNRKPVFYNVSHNQQQVEAYYDTAIEGTTYQWYPIGLVAGHTRRGNFLPYVDQFDIPFANVKGFENKARLVYEFDPADIMYSYMYPAMARTFRKAGFQWITQFAYDPMDMAWANTEYQTHFLNLAYTPKKAISTKIAAEVARSIERGVSCGTYPADTLFGNFRVSYEEDLSELNREEKFFYSNHTNTQPIASEKLLSVAGCGNSPVVSYEGTGAYFIDKLENGLWRLEVMPDALTISDPFAKPSLKKEVVTIVRGAWDMTLRLPDLGQKFTITGVNAENTFQSTVTSGTIVGLQPGVYLLQKQGSRPTRQWNGQSVFGNIRLSEYAAPETRATTYQAVHLATSTTHAGDPLIVEAQIAGPHLPDSVIIYTDKVSFWNKHNPLIKMERTHGYTYRAIVPGEQIKEGTFRYSITVCNGGKQQTFPTGTSGNPLDWDYPTGTYFETNVIALGSAIRLLTVTDEYSHIEAYTMPEGGYIRRQIAANVPTEKATLRFSFESKADSPRFFLRKYIKDAVGNRRKQLADCTHLCLHLKERPKNLRAGFITSDGYTYLASCPASSSTDSSDSASSKHLVRIPLSTLKQTKTALLPHPYPVFLEKYFTPTTEIPFSIGKIESLELSFDGKKEEDGTIEISSFWLE